MEVEKENAQMHNDIWKDLQYTYQHDVVRCFRCFIGRTSSLWTFKQPLFIWRLARKRAKVMQRPGGWSTPQTMRTGWAIHQMISAVLFWEAHALQTGRTTHDHALDNESSQSAVLKVQMLFALDFWAYIHSTITYINFADHWFCVCWGREDSSKMGSLCPTC